jgi:hypothetical protein
MRLSNVMPYKLCVFACCKRITNIFSNCLQMSEIQIYFKMGLFNQTVQHIWKVRKKTASCPQAELVYFCAMFTKKLKAAYRAFVRTVCTEFD